MVQKRNTFNHSRTGDDSLKNKRDVNSEQQKKISPASASGIRRRTSAAPETEQM